MAAVSQSDVIIDALVARLGDISTANTYAAGKNYLTSPVTVARGAKMPQDVGEDKRPALYVASLEPTKRTALPGGMLRKEAKLLVHGYARTNARTQAQKQNESHDLRHDVEKAVMEDVRLGRTCTQCIPRDDDASDTRPTAAQVDGWVTMVFDVLWFEHRTD